MQDFLQKLWQHKSAIVLIAANLVPLAGVLFAGWNAFDVVFLYWLENVVIGFFNICKMLSYGLLANVDLSTGELGAKPLAWQQRLLVLLGMLFMAGFFAFHYGMFTFVHGVFVLTFMQMAQPGGVGGGGGPWAIVPFALGQVRFQLEIPFLVLLASHGFSFIWNFLYGREYTRVAPHDLMQAPYGRVLVMHFTVLFGGFVSIFLPQFMCALLVVLKTGVDVRLHLKEREKGAIRLFERRAVKRA